MNSGTAGDSELLYQIEGVDPKYEDGFATWITMATRDVAAVGSRRVETSIQPRPRFCPERLWHRIVARVVVRSEEPL